MVSICGLAKVLSLKAQKIYGPQLENPQSATIEEGPQILPIFLVRKFAYCGTYLRTANFWRKKGSLCHRDFLLDQHKKVRNPL